jgi:hypothetical protein
MYADQGGFVKEYPRPQAAIDCGPAHGKFGGEPFFIFIY